MKHALVSCLPVDGNVINWELANSFRPRAMVFEFVKNPSEVFSTCNFLPAFPFPLQTLACATFASVYVPLPKVLGE